MLKKLYAFRCLQLLTETRSQTRSGARPYKKCTRIIILSEESPSSGRKHKHVVFWCMHLPQFQHSRGVCLTRVRFPCSFYSCREPKRSFLRFFLWREWIIKKCCVYIFQSVIANLIEKWWTVSSHCECFCLFQKQIQSECVAVFDEALISAVFGSSRL